MNFIRNKTFFECTGHINFVSRIFETLLNEGIDFTELSKHCRPYSSTDGYYTLMHVGICHTDARNISVGSYYFRPAYVTGISKPHPDVRHIRHLVVLNIFGIRLFIVILVHSLV